MRRTVFGCGELAGALRLLVHDELRLCDHAMPLRPLGVDGRRVRRRGVRGEGGQGEYHGMHYSTT